MKRTFSALIAACAGVLARAAAAAPVPETGLGLPRDVSHPAMQTATVHYLLYTTAALTALLFVIMVGLMVTSMLKHREGRHKAEYEHGVGRKHALIAAAISAAIFFVVDGNLFVGSMVHLQTAWEMPDEAGAVRVQVNAQQWAWNFRYPGPDGRFSTDDDVVTLNDLRVPTGRPVILQLAAKDVIHSFYLPNLRHKQDAVPGNITRMWFSAGETGEFEIGCAQHCGTHHYKMRGVLTVLDPAAFERWHAHQSRLSALAYDPADLASHWGWDWDSAVN